MTFIYIVYPVLVILVWNTSLDKVFGIKLLRFLYLYYNAYSKV